MKFNLLQGFYPTFCRLSQEFHLINNISHQLFLATLPYSTTRGIVLALRAVHSPLPSPGGPLHRIAASSASGKRTVFLPLSLQAKLDGRRQKNSLSHLRQAAILCGERGIRTPGTETRTAV